MKRSNGPLTVPGMKVHALRPLGGDPLLETVHQILLQGLQAGHRLVESAFLRDDRAGRMVRIDHDDAVFNAGLCGDLFYLVRYVVERHGLVVGHYLELFFEYHGAPLSFSINRSGGY